MKENYDAPLLDAKSGPAWIALRWLLVIPAALLAALLSRFPLHFVLYQTLSSIIEPYPEAPERILAPFVSTLSFVWVGAKIAPKYQTETAVGLFGLCLLLVGAGIALALTNFHAGNTAVSLQFKGLPVGMGLLGSIAGVILVRWQQKKSTPPINYNN